MITCLCKGTITRDAAAAAAFAERALAGDPENRLRVVFAARGSATVVTIVPRPVAR